MCLQVWERNDLCHTQRRCLDILLCSWYIRIVLVVRYDKARVRGYKYKFKFYVLALDEGTLLRVKVLESHKCQSQSQSQDKTIATILNVICHKGAMGCTMDKRDTFFRLLGNPSNEISFGIEEKVISHGSGACNKKTDKNHIDADTDTNDD